MKNTRLMMLALAVLAADAAPVFAQEQVTIVRRNGERVSGRFEDWVRPTDAVYVRVTQDDQRRFPMADVLVIDVGGDATNLPASETQAAQGADHVLITRGTEVLLGRLANIEGGVGSAYENAPRTVTFKTSGGDRRFRLSEVARIYLGNYPRPTAAAAASLPEGAIRVPGNEQWTATTMRVSRGERVAFTAEGEVQLSGDAGDKATAAGSLKGRTAANAPMPGVLAGALIGRIGNGPPFAIGNQTVPLPMPDSGLLWLGINDDAMADNSGQLVVTMRITPGR